MFPIRDTIRSRTFPLANYGIIAINVLVFLFQSSLSERGFSLVLQSFGLTPANFSFFAPLQWITIFSSMFMHGGWFHLISNMWTLYIFGDNVEDRMGPLRYVAFYLLAGTIAAFTHILISQNLDVPTVGASGAVAGVLGAYFVLFPSARVMTFIPIFILPWFVEIPAFFYLGVWFFSQVANGLMVGGQGLSGIAWWAHIGGFGVGLLLVRWFARRPPPGEIYFHQGQRWPQ
ncbi:MAG: rhomboid family intramembrane serine protease [Anaerolineales bacterium]|nr:MAG: rhomboid family intramembrane serine protease [Anaerolineales bacterium]